MSEENINQPQTETEVSSAANNSDNVNVSQNTEQEQQQTSEEITDSVFGDVQPQEPQESDSEKVKLPETDNEVSETLTTKGFDYEKLQEEYSQYGDITPETRKELAEKGITNEMVDSFIEGRVAIVQQQMTEIANSIGGQEQFETVVNWAKENLSNEEKQAIDAVTDPTIIRVILRDLKHRMEDSDGVIPQHLTGDSGKSPSNLFESMAEVQDAISDPKYAKDEAYRAKVAQKITASREAGKIKF